MFYDKFKIVCAKNGTSPTAYVTKKGMSRSNVTRWKNGELPSREVLQMISDDFGVSIDYLLDNDAKENSPVDSDEAFEYLKELYQKKIMFKTKRKATKRDIEKAMEGLRFDLDYQDDEDK